MSRTSPTDRPALLREATERAITYLGPAGRGVAPEPAALAALHDLPDSLGATGLPADRVLDLLDRLGSPATTLTGRGRYFGFVTGGLNPAGQAAAILAGAWDQNAALPVMSPAAAHLDRIAAGWVADLLGLPEGTVVTFCGGATVANLTGVVTARDALLHRAGWSVAGRGLSGAPPLRVVTGAEAHASVLKALRLAGFGATDVTVVPTDEAGRVDAARFPEVDARTLVLLQAGNVNTGHCDPFADLLPRCREAGAWVHVDGAFGLWAAASPEQAAAVAGVQDADSWATDGHKWLNLPYDCGILACRDRADLERAMGVQAAYLGADEDRPLMNLGIQMSQAARGVLAWAVLAHLGRDGVASLVARTCALAAAFADRLAAAGATVLVPPVLNQVLVRFTDDATTDAVLAAVQADGTCWAGGTTWHGVRAMRISVSDEATTAQDVEAASAAIVRLWREVAN